MVILMDGYGLSEGLFLKNYLGTVSAVPRSNTVSHMGTNPSYAYGKYLPQKDSCSVVNHARTSYELNVNNDGGTQPKKLQKNEVTQVNANSHLGFMKATQMENDEEREKKKEKKWTLGAIFRKKNKKDADDSSNNSDEENKKGFLSRRKFKRDRRKLKLRTNTNGFDVVLTPHKESIKNAEISVEQLWNGDPKTIKSKDELVRFINRHPDVNKTSNALQIPKRSRRDSNLSRSSNGSENTEGKKNRKEMMARVEAKRDMLRDDSSSEEYESYHSSSSLNRHNIDCRRLRRTDRPKRLSKDGDRQNDAGMIKSDFEGGYRLSHNCRWIPKVYCPESSDLDASKADLINDSSSFRSPRSRQKLYFTMKQKSYTTSTFPPDIHCQQARNGMLGLSSSRFNFNKENQPLISCKNQACEENRNFQYSLPKNVSNSEKAHRKTLMDYDQFINSYKAAREKSLSYDQNIQRATCFENDAKINKLREQVKSKKISGVFTKGDDKKADNYNQSPQISENLYSEVAENRNDTAPSLQSGIFPQRPAKIIQISANGNSLCESSRNFYFNHSNSYNQIPIVHGFCSKEDTPRPKPLMNNVYFNSSPGLEFVPQKSHLSETPSVLRYYADQNPRSRNPIHITCNPTASEQPYLSDSQMIVKPVQLIRNSASDFWKLKDKELMKQFKNSNNFLKLPPTQSNPGLERSRSSSPKFKNPIKPASKSSGNDVNEDETISVENNIRKILKEEYNATKVNKSPPEPPVRRLSKQEVLARLQKCEQVKNKESESKYSLKNETKVHSNNLDEALIELEIIYNSLKLKDEDLVDRAERRDLPVFRPENSTVSVSINDKNQNFFVEADFSKNSESAILVKHQRAIPLRRSGVPDKMADDMAFRRMNQKDRMEIRKLPSQSYLRSSPALSPSHNVSPTFRKESPIIEPDIMYDDVMFRNIRHANSTLKIQDPQPPFGIPIGVITPAPDSDYLHATPTERFRPTFTASRTPDVVKDDLAFRNLRKDNKANTCLEHSKNEMKKRAVRSLSANLYCIMQKDSSGLLPMEENNRVVFDKNCEKTQSLTDLTKGKNALEKRLKELKEEKNEKRAEFFELSRKAKKKIATNLSSTNLSNVNDGNFENDPFVKLQKKSPIVELSKFPAAVPSCTLQGNPFKESSFVDDDQLDSLLSALAKEAERTSKDLERQLDRLDTKKVSIKCKVALNANETSKARAIEEFDKTFKILDKSKRKRNLSLSNANDLKEEVRKTGSLERRKKTDKNEFIFPELMHSKTEETKSTNRLMDVNDFCKAGSKTERKLSKSGSSSSLGCKERTRSQCFEAVPDLSQILHDVEVEQHVNNKIILKETNNVFQEVFEYNCKPPPPERRGGDEDVEAITDIPRIPDTMSDVEMEFEKLHREVNSTKETKETEFATVDDLMADITSVDRSLRDSYSFFPFPKNNKAPSSSRTLKHKDGTFSKSSKGEGEAKKETLDNNMLLSCSYAIALAFYVQEIDFLTALGIVLAVISVVAILIL